jgi:hypothetical protein
MVDLLAQIAQRQRDAPITIAPLITSEDSLNLLFQRLILVRCLGRVQLIVKGAACQTGDFEQAGQWELPP